MILRVEFSDSVKREIFTRAGGVRNLRCECCGMPLAGKRFEYDHIVEEWELEMIARELRAPLTAEDGRLLCIPCHDEKTARKTGERAHGKRLVKKVTRAKTTKWRPLPCGRNSLWKKPMGSRNAVKRG